ncbi:unnamed protein product [Dicrocoelium dendriticum]|nr:unnamed protein product [Dicrocoelium dendriticum]CAH8499850.1 unnamed protein product [Dicrocoelium dendriticum]
MVRVLVTKAEADAFFEENQEKLIVVDFYAEWCPPCQKISPIFEELANQFQDVCFVKVDVDANRPTSKEYNIKCMPTFVFMKNKRIVHQFSGADEVQLRQSVAKFH